jgi:integrase/recombinase XerD
LGLGGKTKTNPQRQRRADRPPAGSINSQTGKPSLRDGYAPATINHRLSVVAAFYDQQRRLGRGPATNPVPTEVRGGRRNAHHNPMEPWQPGPRAAYRQKTERRLPRAIPNERYEQLFAILTSDRDRAIISLLVSTGARAGELLGMTDRDVDWGGQRVRLVGKGTRDAQWVAAWPAFFRWLASYLAGERPPLGDAGPLWVTLRQPVRPLGYQALRAVLLRANEQLDTNWTLHDLRHTCALRLASDPQRPARRCAGALAPPAPDDHRGLLGRPTRGGHPPRAGPPARHPAGPGADLAGLAV